MHSEIYTDLNKVIYLVCCEGIQLEAVLEPVNLNSKARFKIVAESYEVLKTFEDKWERRKDAGPPSTSDVRKLLFKRKELCTKALKAVEKFKSSHQ